MASATPPGWNGARSSQAVPSCVAEVLRGPLWVQLEATGRPVGFLPNRLDSQGACPDFLTKWPGKRLGNLRHRCANAGGPGPKPPTGGFPSPWPVGGRRSGKHCRRTGSKAHGGNTLGKVGGHLRLQQRIPHRVSPVVGHVSAFVFPMRQSTCSSVWGP